MDGLLGAVVISPIHSGRQVKLTRDLSGTGWCVSVARLPGEPEIEVITVTVPVGGEEDPIWITRYQGQLGGKSVAYVETHTVLADAVTAHLRALEALNRCFPAATLRIGRGR